MAHTPRSFSDRYLERVRLTGSVLCVGIDPTADHVPPTFRNKKGQDDVQMIWAYIKEVIKTASTRAPVVKFQYAHFARFRDRGLMMLGRMIEIAKEAGLLVILDAKRSDIDTTMEAYGDEVFGRFNADSTTTNPYFGDTFNPAWMKWLAQGRMAITMVRTSNPEATPIQDVVLEEGIPLYAHIARLTAEWNERVRQKTNGLGSVGGVIGATVPEQAKDCVRMLGDEPFRLVPGYGAQGGGSEGAVVSLVNSRREIVGTVNSSRGITHDSWFDKETQQPRPSDPLELVATAIESANADLNAALRSVHGISIAKVIPAEA